VILRVISLDLSLNEYAAFCLLELVLSSILESLSTSLIFKEIIIQVQAPKIYIQKLLT
jgi:hypothetical protein